MNIALREDFNDLMCALDEGRATVSGIARHLNRGQIEIERLYLVWKRRQS